MARSEEQEEKKQSWRKELWVIPIAILLPLLTFIVYFFMQSNDNDEPDDKSSTADITVVQPAAVPNPAALHVA